MAISKDLTITVSGKKSVISNKLYLYLGDGAVTLLIKIIQSEVVFGAPDLEMNIIEQDGAIYGNVCILKSNNELVYSKKCPIVNGKLKFVISKEFIDEIAEEGTHLLQIHLYDAEEGGNRYTIPPVSITILKPICDIGHDSNTP